ncbi:hypothetical protein [Rhodococcus sp. PD04]|uniref:hypothetical protein n=1 Tax=Rhodococcus sp. PD04 TaxID=3109594 RepID=UPI002DD86937|nr:hypothetical protein [Rhodococcus sp. PD04]WSE22336.1 hypothetical protein U9J23_22225 [Rhodococcus sp. PD04]
MARKPDLPCAGCGRLMWRGKGTLPPGQARCRDCRKAAAPTAAKTARRSPAKGKSPAIAGSAALAPEPVVEPEPLEDPGPRPRAGTLSAAVETDDRATILRALRLRLTKAIEESTSARDIAALSKQLLDVLAQLDALEGRTGAAAPERRSTPLDELNKRRAARIAGAANRRSS